MDTLRWDVNSIQMYLNCFEHVERSIGPGQASGSHGMEDRAHEQTDG